MIYFISILAGISAGCFCDFILENNLDLIFKSKLSRSVKFDRPISVIEHQGGAR